MREFLQVDPRILRLPASRRDGADPWKLRQQIARFGASVDGMPDIIVYRGRDGLLLIWEGVTRATRVALLAPGMTVRVEILAEKDKDISGQPRVEDRVPWHLRPE